MTQRANIASVATEQQALEHVSAEMAARDISAGDVARILASKGIRFSSETLSRNLRTGHLTAMVRKGLAVAFEWPADWPENLPELSKRDPAKRLGSNDDVMQRLDRIEELVQLLVQGQNDLVEGQQAGLDGLRKLATQLAQRAPRRAAQ